MATIIGLCGSLRRGSFNGLLLRAAVDAAPPGTIHTESIREIPFYDGDAEEEQGLPPAVQRLEDRIAEADGLLIVTPEYNNSMPGVLKNAIDWLSRPAAATHPDFRRWSFAFRRRSAASARSSLARPWPHGERTSRTSGCDHRGRRTKRVTIKVRTS